MEKEFRQAIRKQYQAMMPYITSRDGRCDVYQVFPWVSCFTPIEEVVWNTIRTLGLRMFPQLPVKSYFLDFADPIRKIAVEADGKEYHKDYLKDQKRDSELKNDGWRVIRITGREIMMKCEIQEFYEKESDEEEPPFCSCVDCVLRPLRKLYG